MRQLTMRPFRMIGLAGLLAGCGFLGGGESDPCRPVDVGGMCFAPSADAFAEHALISAGAWPQLDGMELSAAAVIEGTDLSQNAPTWLVPLLAGNRMVAISRFVPVPGGEAKLGEVALLEEPLDELPDERGGELILFVDSGCAEDPSLDCLFNEMRWAIQLGNGAFELPDGRVVEDLPGRGG